jgi:hypothetical protein
MVTSAASVIQQLFDACVCHIFSTKHSTPKITLLLTCTQAAQAAAIRRAIFATSMRVL